MYIYIYVSQSWEHNKNATRSIVMFAKGYLHERLDCPKVYPILSIYIITEFNSRNPY